MAIARRCLPPLLVWAILAVPLLSEFARATPFPGTTPGVDIGGSLTANFEPSGGAWHPLLNKLFVVGDNGAIARMNFDGSGTTNWAVAGDWEGVAVADPSSNFIYIGNEDNGHIREFNFVAGSLTARDFNLLSAPAAIGVTPLNAADMDALENTTGGDGTGLEALAFVPDVSEPEGGLFYVGSQENGNIYKFRLSLSAGSTVTYLGKFKTWPAGYNDLSGLEYDWNHNLLLAVWDANDVIRAMRTDGTLLLEWPIPAGSNDEEGLGYNGLSLFITEDPAPESEVRRYDNFVFVVPEPHTAALVLPALAMLVCYGTRRRVHR